MTDRTSFLRRAGGLAAGVSLGGLLGPAAAFGSGGGDFPDHPRWRFVLVSHDTLDPQFVATQFGAQDAASLVHCSVEWTGSPSNSPEETARVLRSVVSHKADGIAVSLPDVQAAIPGLEAARQAKIPVVAFSLGVRNGRVPFVGPDPRAAGQRAGRELARLAPGGKVVLVAPSKIPAWQDARLDGLHSVLAGRATVVQVSGDLRRLQAEVGDAIASARAAVALDRAGTVALGNVLKRTGSPLPAAGFDLLPDDLALVSGGQLAFAVDQQPYLQGFSPVMQLFLARISEGTVRPSGTETTVLLRKADVQPYVATKSRFEGSSSRHDYPLRRV